MKGISLLWCSYLAITRQTSRLADSTTVNDQTRDSPWCSSTTIPSLFQRTPKDNLRHSTSIYNTISIIQQVFGTILRLQSHDLHHFNFTQTDDGVGRAKPQGESQLSSQPDCCSFCPGCLLAFFRLFGCRNPVWSPLCCFHTSSLQFSSCWIGITLFSLASSFSLSWSLPSRRRH